MEKKSYRFVIPTKLPSLNAYVDANRTNYHAGAKMKKDLQTYIRGCIYSNLGRLKIKKPIIAHFTWIEDNKRRDLDNIASAKKFIFDALVQTEVLQNDNWRWVKGFSDKFEHKKTAMVIVELEETEELE